VLRPNDLRRVRGRPQLGEGGLERLAQGRMEARSRAVRLFEQRPVRMMLRSWRFLFAGSREVPGWCRLQSAAGSH